MTDKWTIGNWITVALIAALILYSVRKPQHGHTCRWDNCPYKGATPAEYKNAVNEYVGAGDGEEGTDAWCIDMLHLQYPSAGYEELEEKLFSNNKKDQQ